VPLLFVSAIFIGILSNLSSTINAVQTAITLQLSYYKAYWDYIFDTSHMWVIKCDTESNSGQCSINMTWLKAVGIALVMVPAYAFWAGSFILEHLVSVVTSGYYIYMTGFLSFDWLYSLSRNLIHKKITNFAFWYSVSILGLNLLALIIPTTYLGIYIINYLITEDTDA
jgi:hypothetical protein